MTPSDPSTQTTRVVDFWTERHGRADHGTHDNFFNHPLVHAYVSLRCFGNLTGHLDAVIGEIRTRSKPGARIFSPGCGTAEKEMALATALPDRHFSATDITPAILDVARAEMDRRGIKNLELRLGDFNHLDLEPRSFDIITALGSVHHVEALEQFWAVSRQALRPGGCILAQEYIGPNRLQWEPVQCAWGTRALREIVPTAHQVHHREVVPTPLEEMLALDPSEAVRSRDILSTCKAAGFEFAGYAGAGCALLQPVLMNQIHTFAPQDWQHNLVLSRLFAEEDRLMREGVLGDDFAMWVAVPR